VIGKINKLIGVEKKKEDYQNAFINDLKKKMMGTNKDISALEKGEA
jgi:hypothetical protein